MNRLPKVRRLKKGQTEPAMTRLKLLPAEDRARIYAWSLGNLDECREKIRKEFGINIRHNGKISTWRAWQIRQMDFDDQNSYIEQIRDFLKKYRPNMGPEQMRQAEFIALSRRAERLGDHRLWLATLQEMGRDEDRALARAKFQFDAAREALAKLPELRAIAADKSLDEDAKLKAVREKLFGEVPE